MWHFKVDGEREANGEREYHLPPQRKMDIHHLSSTFLF